jgi:hypothetical protein
MDATAITAYFSIALSTGAAIYTILNHSRVRSNCCGHKIEMSVDVERTSPPAERIQCANISAPK